MIGDYVERLHKRDLKTSGSNIVPEDVACSLYLNGTIQIKGEYSLVVYCKCLNEGALCFEIFTIYFSLTTATMGYHRLLNKSRLSQPLLNRSFYQGMVRLFW